MHNFRELKVWQEGCELVFLIYQASKSFPDAEKFGLTSQMRRAAVSIPSNIAEGSSRSSSKHFLQYLETAYGSAFELETQAILACQLGFITKEKHEALSEAIDKLQRMLYRFMQRIKNS
jgi:four helix bundle protein